jgi:hypothetical protein
MHRIIPDVADNDAGARINDRSRAFKSHIGFGKEHSDHGIGRGRTMRTEHERSADQPIPNSLSVK